MTNTRAPGLTIVVLGCLALACSTAGTPTPAGSPASSPIPSADSSAAVRPSFSEAEVPKVAAGVPPENVPVTFEETGAPGQTISYTLTAQATVSYQCWNPQTQEIDTQRETVSRQVAAGINLTADAEGSVRGTLQLAPPRPEKLSCR